MCLHARKVDRKYFDFQPRGLFQVAYWIKVYLLLSSQNLKFSVFFKIIGKNKKKLLTPEYLGKLSFRRNQFFFFGVTQNRITVDA